MGEVYSNAATAYVWLGEEVCCTDFSLGRARELRELGKVPEPWIQTAMNHLFALDYWARAWIVQEFLVYASINKLASVFPLPIVHIALDETCEKLVQKVQIQSFRST